MKSRNIAMVLVGLLAAVLVLGTGCQNVTPQAETPYIAVQGAGQVKTTPDEVQISITIATETEDATAQEENAQKVQAVIDELQEIGLTEEEIQTTGANFFPRTRWDDGREVQLGYRAENYLQVETKQLDLISAIIDRSVAAGAERVGGLNFMLSDEAKENLLEDALDSAVQDARSQAEITLRALDQEVAGIKRIEVVKEHSYPMLQSADMMRGMGTEEAQETPIIPGEVDFNINIVAEFFIR